MNEKMPRIDDKDLNADGEISHEDLNEMTDVMFKVCLLNPQPEMVKISKKNTCIVTIVMSDDEEDQDDGEKMLQYFVQSREPSWSQQFKNAVMLGPSIDQDNFIID
jgi:hypothetical protein